MINKKNKNTLKNDIIKLEKKIKSSFPIKSVVVYKIDNNTTNLVIGEALDNISLERYLSFKNTTILVSPDNKYKSKLIFQISTSETVTLLFVINSYYIECFDFGNEKMILDIVKKTKIESGD